MNNTRVIHGIISVPNRIGIKRNQIFDDSYKENISVLETKINETSISLDLMIQKPLETNSKSESTPEEKESSEIEEKTEVVENESIRAHNGEPAELIEIVASNN